MGAVEITQPWANNDGQQVYPCPGTHTPTSQNGAVGAVLCGEYVGADART